MANDIVELMVSEGVGVVVGVAHDWYVWELLSLSGCCHIQVVSNGGRLRR